MAVTRTQAFWTTDFWDVEDGTEIETFDFSAPSKRTAQSNLTLEKTAADHAALDGDGTIVFGVNEQSLLVEEEMAYTLLLGCAGIERHVKPLEDALGSPVTEPTQTATVQALGAVLFSLPKGRHTD